MDQHLVLTLIAMSQCLLDDVAGIFVRSISPWVSKQLFCNLIFLPAATVL